MRIVIFFILALAVHGSCAAVDAVYTWVDGSDPVWQKAFIEALSQNVSQEASAPKRFRNHDELKYSLRSLWKHATFIDHIYIVTFSQTPSWLKIHPKITIVDHREIFYSQRDLPTFNSQAIEANLHHIPNLAEDYIYCNDDVFFGKDVVKSDFFTKNGKPKLFLASWITPDSTVVATDESFEASWKNTNAFLNRLYGYKRRYALEHAPFAFCRSLQYKVEKSLPGIFRRVSSHKFRSLDDYVVTAGLSQYYLDQQGYVKHAHASSSTIGLTSNLEQTRLALQEIITKQPTFFCIEDAMDEPCSACEHELRNFLEAYFPEKAPWEL